MDASEVIPAVPRITAAQWFSQRLENAFVSLVNLRRLMRVLKLLRSTIEMQMRSGSGCPMLGTTSTDATSAGE